MATPMKIRQCDCGAYRQAVKVKGEWVWAAGCRACDKIERLEQLLGAGVKVYTGSTVTNSPTRLHERAEKAEKEADRLATENRRLEEELLRANMEAKRARSSARAAQESAERVRQQCRMADIGVAAGGEGWN